MLFANHFQNKQLLHAKKHRHYLAYNENIYSPGWCESYIADFLPGN